MVNVSLLGPVHARRQASLSVPSVRHISRHCECDWEMRFTAQGRPAGWAVRRLSGACPLRLHRRARLFGW